MTRLLFLLLFFTYPLTAQTPAETGPTKPAIEKSAEPKLPAYFQEEFEKEEKGGGGRFYKEFFNMLISLGLIIGVLFIILFLLKRLLHTRAEQMNDQSAIKILEQRSLSSKASLYLLEVADKSLLISESPSGVSIISEFPKSHRSFQEVLDKKNELP